MIKRLSIFIFFILAFTALQAKDIIIYHTSDTHGAYFPLLNRNNRMQGGFAALKSVVSKEILPFLLLDSGDFTQGNLEADKSKGATSVMVFNEMGYHAVTIGNHEFDFGQALGNNALNLKADILAANFTQSIPNAKAYKVYELDGVKIAVIGMGLNSPENKAYKMSDYKEAFQTAMTEAAAQSPDAVILLIHASQNDARNFIKPADIMTAANGKAHAVLQGHAHQKGIKEVKGIFFVDSGSKAQDVSRITLTFDDNTNQHVKTQAEIIPLIIDNVGEDADMKSFIESLRNTDLDREIAAAKDSFPFESEDTAELDGSLANLLSDAMKHRAGADIAIINTAALRNDIPRGAVRERDLNQAMPYDDMLATMKMKGSALKDVIKQSITRNASVFQYSGLQIEAVFKGEKLINLSVEINGKNLKDNKIYLVATDAFLAAAQKYEAVIFKETARERKVMAENISTRDILIEALGAARQAPSTGRIKIREATPKEALLDELKTTP